MRNNSGHRRGYINHSSDFQSGGSLSHSINMPSSVAGGGVGLGIGTSAPRGLSPSSPPSTMLLQGVHHLGGVHPLGSSSYLSASNNHLPNGDNNNNNNNHFSLCSSPQPTTAAATMSASLPINTFFMRDRNQQNTAGRGKNPSTTTGRKGGSGLRRNLWLILVVAFFGVNVFVVMSVFVNRSTRGGDDLSSSSGDRPTLRRSGNRMSRQIQLEIAPHYAIHQKEDGRRKQEDGRKDDDISKGSGDSNANGNPQQQQQEVLKKKSSSSSSSFDFSDYYASASSATSVTPTSSHLVSTDELTPHALGYITVPGLTDPITVAALVYDEMTRINEFDAIVGAVRKNGKEKENGSGGGSGEIDFCWNYDYIEVHTKASSKKKAAATTAPSPSDEGTAYPPRNGAVLAFPLGHVEAFIEGEEDNKKNDRYGNTTSDTRSSGGSLNNTAVATATTTQRQPNEQRQRLVIDLVYTYVNPAAKSFQTAIKTRQSFIKARKQKEADKHREDVLKSGGAKLMPHDKWWEAQTTLAMSTVAGKEKAAAAAAVRSIVGAAHEYLPLGLMFAGENNNNDKDRGGADNKKYQKYIELLLEGESGQGDNLQSNATTADGAEKEKLFSSAARQLEEDVDKFLVDRFDAAKAKLATMQRAYQRALLGGEGRDNKIKEKEGEEKVLDVDPSAMEGEAENVVDPQRYRDWDELLYSLRGVYYNLMGGGSGRYNKNNNEEAAMQMNSSTVRNIYIVMSDRDQAPAWLLSRNGGSSSSSSPSSPSFSQDFINRIVLVEHREIVPRHLHPTVLPTFNSYVIESVIHRIPGLARHYIYFNNDMLLARPVSFFDYFQPHVVYPSPSPKKGGDNTNNDNGAAGNQHGDNVAPPPTAPEVRWLPMVMVDRLAKIRCNRNYARCNVWKDPLLTNHLQWLREAFGWNDFLTMSKRLSTDERYLAMPMLFYSHYPHLIDKHVMGRLMEGSNYDPLTCVGTAPAAELVPYSNNNNNDNNNKNNNKEKSSSSSSSSRSVDFVAEKVRKMHLDANREGFGFRNVDGDVFPALLFNHYQLILRYGGDTRKVAKVLEDLGGYSTDTTRDYVGKEKIEKGGMAMVDEEPIPLLPSPDADSAAVDSTTQIRMRIGDGNEPLRDVFGDVSRFIDQRGQERRALLSHLVTLSRALRLVGSKGIKEFTRLHLSALGGEGADDALRNFLRGLPNNLLVGLEGTAGKMELGGVFQKNGPHDDDSVKNNAIIGSDPRHKIVILNEFISIFKQIRNGTFVADLPIRFLEPLLASSASAAATGSHFATQIPVAHQFMLENEDNQNRCQRNDQNDGAAATTTIAQSPIMQFGSFNLDLHCNRRGARAGQLNSFDVAPPFILSNETEKKKNNNTINNNSSPSAAIRSACLPRYSNIPFRTNNQRGGYDHWIHEWVGMMGAAAMPLAASIRCYFGMMRSITPPRVSTMLTAMPSSGSGGLSSPPAAMIVSSPPPPPTPTMGDTFTDVMPRRGRVLFLTINDDLGRNRPHLFIEMKQMKSVSQAEALFLLSRRHTSFEGEDASRWASNNSRTHLQKLLEIIPAPPTTTTTKPPATHTNSKAKKPHRIEAKVEDLLYVAFGGLEGHQLRSSSRGSKRHNSNVSSSTVTNSNKTPVEIITDFLMNHRRQNNPSVKRADLEDGDFVKASSALLADIVALIEQHVFGHKRTSLASSSSSPLLANGGTRVNQNVKREDYGDEEKEEEEKASVASLERTKFFPPLQHDHDVHHGGGGEGRISHHLFRIRAFAAIAFLEFKTMEIDQLLWEKISPEIEAADAEVGRQLTLIYDEFAPPHKAPWEKADSERTKIK